jgi:hypothetical protein
MFICFSGSARSQVILSLIFGDKLNSEELMFGIQCSIAGISLSNIDPSSSSKNSIWVYSSHYKLNDQWQINTEPMAKYTRGAVGMTPYYTWRFNY